MLTNCSIKISFVVDGFRYIRKRKPRSNTNEISETLMELLMLLSKAQKRRYDQQFCIIVRTRLINCGNSSLPQIWLFFQRYKSFPSCIFVLDKIYLKNCERNNDIRLLLITPKLDIYVFIPMDNYESFFLLLFIFLLNKR
jgi:hypothetical protein